MSEIEKKAKKLRAKYQREWRSRNKDKVAAINKRYWNKKAAALIEQEHEDIEPNTGEAKQ